MTIHLERLLPDASCNQPGRQAGKSRDIKKMPHHPYLVLLLVGFALPLALPQARCALAAPFHPCRNKSGGLFSVALSLRLPPPDVIRHHNSVEPGLSSITRGNSGHPANWQRCDRVRAKGKQDH
jgi:hypothetical protein